MKKIKKKKKLKKKKQNFQKESYKVSTNRPSFDGKLGAFSRFYPQRVDRDKTIENIKLKLPENRLSDEWWKLGEYTIFNALLDENDDLLNEGIAALTSGANHKSPSVACLLDLGWILMFKNMDILALPNLQKAAELAPFSRDVSDEDQTGSLRMYFL